MKVYSLVLILLFAGVVSRAQSFQDLENMQRFEGLFDFYYDESQDHIYLILEAFDKEFLYVHGLSTGVGSNDLGLDRGQIGGEAAVVFFRKAGNRVLLVQSNPAYRAVTDNEAEKAAVEEAFARSVLHGFEVSDQQKGRYLIDITPMLMYDAHGVSATLAATGQGNYTVDKDRSAIELAGTRAFPENVEFEALLTFTGKPEGRLIRSVTPDPHHITVIQHHSFIQLPDSGYKPRVYHPGSGCISLSYMDYATPVYEPIRKNVIIRHRLEKKNPKLPVSEPVEPIVYYLDNGTPEPIRSALLEGGRWWNEAFEAIGYKNAFRVEILPKGADPLDVRYNMIQWVHRSTRGWSYGNAVVDPRTGEILKGHVSLGSLRIRQDFMIAQALLNRPFATDDENHKAMMEFALARIRQLSAHELGHTLGFTHNFAASSIGNISVMDYPHPMVKVVDGEIVTDEAYEEGIAPWDKVTVAYAYGSFEGDESDGLQELLDDAYESGLRFISDSDARAPGGAHPNAHLWDNGSSAVDELERVLEVRRTGIRHFSIDNIRSGEPYATLEDLFVPLYFFHRYQVEAAVKLIGGVDYSYGVKGDVTPPMKYVEGAVQLKALEQLLRTLSPQVLMIPEEKLELFPPRAPGYARNQESFNGQTGVTFDYLAAPASAANLTLQLLLHPERANRLVEQKALDSKLPGLEETVEALIGQTVKEMPEEPGYEAEVRHTVNFIVIDHLIRLSTDEHAIPQVRAIVKKALSNTQEWLEKQEVEGIIDTYRLASIEQIKENKVKYLEDLPAIPPGAPIGMD